MAKVTVERASYALGYNDRDNPTDLRTSAGQALENLFPGDPNPVPRPGIAKAGDFADLKVYESIPLRISTPTGHTDYMFFLTAFGVWKYCELTGDEPEILDVDDISDIGFSPIEDHRIAWVQVRERIYIVTTSSVGPVWVLERNPLPGSKFIIREANVPMVNAEINHIEATEDIDGEFPAGKYAGFGFTLVRREDGDAFDGSGNPIEISSTDAAPKFNPGVSESPFSYSDDAKQFIVLDNSSSTDPAFVWMEVWPPDAGSATHIRVWQTLAADSFEEAEGLELRWTKDVPAYGPHAPFADPLAPGYLRFRVDVPQSTLAGTTETLKVIGYSNPPPGDMIAYVSGRLWIGSRAYPNDLVGRWYYSEIPQDPESPTKWQSMFRQDMYYKDTSLENSDRSVGIAPVGTDLVFLMSSSVWYLRDGDPDFEPLPLPNAPGALGAYTTEDQILFYLSSSGPFYASQRMAHPIESFTSKEVWPRDYLGRSGHFMSGEVASRSFMWRHADALWVCDPETQLTVGCYMPESGQGAGALRVIPARQNMTPMFRPRPLGDTCYVTFSQYTATGRTWVWRWLDDGENLDGGDAYTMRAVSKRFYTNQRNPEVMADLQDMLFFAQWTGLEPLTLRVRGDAGARFSKSVTSAALTADTNINRPGDFDLSAAVRQMVYVVFEEAVSSIGRNFEVEWSRKNDAPFDFLTRGFKVALLTVPAWSPENAFVGKDDGPGPDVLVINAGSEEVPIPSDSDSYDAGEDGRDPFGEYIVLDAQR